MAEYTALSRIDKTKGLKERRMAGAMAMNQFQKSFDLADTRRKEEKRELEDLTKKSQEEYEKIYKKSSELKKTGGDSIDQAALKLFEEEARALASQYMDAYGPDGTPELVQKYITNAANLNKDLDEFTVLIGTLDAETDLRDKAIADGTLIIETDEDGNKIIDTEQEQFKNGIFAGGAGNRKVTIARGPNGIMINDPSGKSDGINLRQYNETLKKNGSTYKVAGPKVNEFATGWGKKYIDGIGAAGQPTKWQGVHETITDPNDPTKTIDITTSYSTNDPEGAREEIYQGLIAEEGFKPVQGKEGSISMPDEAQLWRMLQQEGFIDKYEKNMSYDKGVGGYGLGLTNPKASVSWDQWGADSILKDRILKSAYADYLVSPQAGLFPAGKLNKTNKLNIQTSGYNNQNTP
jgi:hypothetical protein